MRGGFGGPDDRLRRRPGALQRHRDGVQGGRLGQSRWIERCAVRRRAADRRSAVRGPAGAPEDPGLGRRDPPDAGLDERRQARGSRPGSPVWRAGHRPVPDRAHVPRGRAAGDRAWRDPRRDGGHPGQGEGGHRGQARRRGGRGGQHVRCRDGQAGGPPAGRLRGHLPGDGRAAGRDPADRPAAPRVPAQPRGAAGQGDQGRRRGAARRTASCWRRSSRSTSRTRCSACAAAGSG